MELQRNHLQRRDELRASSLLLDFFREVDQKVESYIETLEVENNRALMGSIRRGLRGKGTRLEDFRKNRGLQ